MCRRVAAVSLSACVLFVCEGGCCCCCCCRGVATLSASLFTESPVWFGVSASHTFPLSADEEAFDSYEAKGSHKVREEHLSVLFKHTHTLIPTQFFVLLCPGTFVGCSMTNVLGREKLEGDEIPSWLKTKEKGGASVRPKATSSVPGTRGDMLPQGFWTYAPGPSSRLFIAAAITVLNCHGECHRPPRPISKKDDISIGAAPPPRRAAQVTSCQMQRGTTSSAMQTLCVKYSATAFSH